MNMDLDLSKPVDTKIRAIIAGQPGCLSEETFIPYNVVDKRTGKKCNRKGGSIKRLFERFNGIKGTKMANNYIDNDKEFFIPSLKEDKTIILNKVIDVIYSGVKEVYEVITVSGKRIKATKDHKFYNGVEYKPLEDFDFGESVYIHTNYIPKNGRKKRIHRKEVMVKNNPYWNKKVVNGCTYYRTRKSRAVIEAQMNEYSYEEYIKLLNDVDGKPRVIQLKTLSREYDVHHIDGDYTNDNIKNLKVVTKKEHQNIHLDEAKSHIKYHSYPEIIDEVNYVGLEETYDICMQAPYHNFVANNFVVHNSGKTHFSGGCPRSYIIFTKHGEEQTIQVRPELRKNVVKAVMLSPSTEDLKEVFGNLDKGKEDGLIHKHVEEAKQMYKDGLIDTLVIDNLTYLSSYLKEYIWTYCSKISPRTGELDTQSMYGDLNRRLTKLVGLQICSFPGNLILTCHEMLESDEAMEKKSDKDSNIVLNLDGGFRNKVEGMLSMVLFLSKKEKQGVYTYWARSNKGAMKNAKSRIPLPAVIQDISYGKIMQVLKDGLKQGGETK